MRLSLCAKSLRQSASLSTPLDFVRPARMVLIIGWRLERAALQRQSPCSMSRIDRPEAGPLARARHTTSRCRSTATKSWPQQKGIYDELGYTDCSEIKDRQYFHSIYCRAPGGILIECAASVPQSFAVDEPADELGTSLLLPPWFESRRQEIEAMLEPIRVPEGNLPKGHKTVAAPPPPSPKTTASTAEQAPGGYRPISSYGRGLCWRGPRLQ